MINWRMTLQVINISVCVLLITFSLGCNGVGPCVHTNKEAILHIESVNNSQTGAIISTIVLSQITRDSVKINLMWLTPISTNVVVYDSTLICNVPCSFGTESGEYRFIASARGYADTLITCFPVYSINKGGCPSYSDGGLRISFKMRPL
jgi:hypothetical protein